MKGIKINKRLLKPIRVRHLAITKTKEANKEQVAENITKPVTEEIVDIPEKPAEEKKNTKKAKKESDKKNEDNKENEE